MDRAWKTELPPEDHGERSIFSTASRTKKILISAAIYYCTFAFGVGFTFLGPTILDYSNKFDEEVSTVSTVFSIFTGSYLVGAALNGILNRFVNRQLFVMVLFAIGSSTLFIYPHVTSLAIFFTLAAILGVFAGGYDTAQVAWVIDIWRHEAAPFILTQHFFFSLGTVVPPLVLSPFLKGESNDDDLTTTTMTTVSPGGSTTPEEKLSGDLRIPFSVGGGIMVVAILVQLSLYFVVVRSLPKVEKTAKEIEKAAGGGKFEFPPRRQIILIALSCCCIASYQGMEICTMQFLPTFAHYSGVRMTESEGADVLFGLTIAYCVFRLIGIFVVLKTPPHYILAGNFVLLIAANLILVLLSGDSVTWMWIGSCLMGAALSTAFPAYFAYIEKYLFISDTVSAIILLTGGGVSAIYPIIIGGIIEEEPRVMIYTNFFSLAVLIGAFAVTFWLTYMKEKKGEAEGVGGGSIKKGVENNNYSHSED